MLNETIEGGAFLSQDGKTWIDANGQPLNERDASRAQKLSAESQADMDRQDVQLMESEAMRDPVARALSALLRQQVAPAAKSEK